EGPYRATADDRRSLDGGPRGPDPAQVAAGGDVDALQAVLAGQERRGPRPGHPAEGDAAGQGGSLAADPPEGARGEQVDVARLAGDEHPLSREQEGARGAEILVLAVLLAPVLRREVRQAAGQVG